MGKGARIAGWVIHGLIGALMIFAGVSKLFGLIPPDAMAEMAKSGLDKKLTLIGAGEIVAAVLMLIPRTSSLGVLAVSGFWGGVICTHMLKGESMAPWSIALALTWVGAWLRDRRALYSFSANDRPAPAPAVATTAA